MIANRYHSAIFAIKQAVPVVCIAYEHKAKGVMRQAGVEECLIDIGELSFEKLSGAIRRAWDNRQAIRRTLQEALPNLRKSARISSVAVAAMLRCLGRKQPDRQTLAAEIERLEGDL